MVKGSVLAGVLGVLLVCCAAAAQEAPKEPPPFVPVLVKQAEAVATIVESDLARAFLARAAELPEIPTRTILRDPQSRDAFTEEQAAALPQEQRERLRPRPYGSSFYYTTGYGSPIIYARPLDILAKHGVGTLAGKRVLDFGYGMIGQERMFALMGADIHGVDVEPMFAALYSWPGDTGEMKASDGTTGTLTLHHGQWPADAKVAEAVGGGYDVIMSKNTLKMGYIHPARETDPRMLVHLGVSDEEFLKAVHGALRPGGLFMVYNISGKQSPPDKPYLPHADGLFPFERTLAEKVGFEVLAFDEPDHEKMAEVFVAVGSDQGKGKEKMLEELFTHYTVLRRAQ